MNHINDVLSQNSTVDIIGCLIIQSFSWSMGHQTFCENGIWTFAENVSIDLKYFTCRNVSAYIKKFSLIFLNETP